MLFNLVQFDVVKFFWDAWLLAFVTLKLLCFDYYRVYQQTFFFYYSHTMCVIVLYIFRVFVVLCKNMCYLTVYWRLLRCKKCCCLNVRKPCSLSGRYNKSRMNRHTAYYTTCCYFAKSTLRVSRITFTLICPGYSNSLSILRATSFASNTKVSSFTCSGLTIIRISRPACTA